MVEKREARKLLQEATGKPDTKFMDGQWEAIDAIVNQRRRVLLVQRTGWGKSMVYFLSTKILRDEGAGTTLIISPLLALMRNQVTAAERLGLRAATINSNNPDDWASIMSEVRAGAVDLLLISPERLENQAFLDGCLLPIADKIEFVVIDEAHCISDWGHDFRPSYRRINRFLRQLPENIAVLATTATANDRVVADVLEQLGNDTTLQRGPLLRSSIALQSVDLPDRASRMAWLAQALPMMAGSGIIYVSTIRDANSVTAWLQSQGIAAEAYHGSLEAEERERLEDSLLGNEIKALVSTNALGMGFDKPDLAFVVHFQAPQSIVHYYQQVGRAGRGIPNAFGILMSGEEDDEINNYFIAGAYPRDRDMVAVIDALDESDGLSVLQLLEIVNMRQGQLEKVLKLLAVRDPSPVVKDGSKWYRNANPIVDDREHVQKIAAQRVLEWEKVKEYAVTDTCLMEFLGQELDDPAAAPCGECAVCVGTPAIDVKLDQATLDAASRFIRRSEVPIEPRKQWKSGAFPTYGWRGNIPVDLRNEEGRALSIWRDSGWAQLVEAGKNAGRFPDELVQACVDMLGRWTPRPAPQWVTCIPSLRSPELVPEFAGRLAGALGIPFSPAIVKVNETARQRKMMNSYQQANNLDGAFVVDPAQLLGGPVLLIDDVIDSGWSLAVAGTLLRAAGGGPVFPLALASASANSAG
jgi:ATP-dependent DNA helicase RecQ